MRSIRVWHAVAGTRPTASSARGASSGGDGASQLLRTLLLTVSGASTLAVLVACGGAERDPGRSRDGDGAQGAGVPSAAAPGTVGSGCRMEGEWTPCAVEDRLLHAGVVLDRQAEGVRHDFLRVPGTLYHVGSADHQLQVFLYASDADRRRDTDALDSATASPPGVRVAWPAPPTLVTSQNLAAIILSLNDRTVERLALALGAGLPQPAPR